MDYYCDAGYWINKREIILGDKLKSGRYWNLPDFIFCDNILVYRKLFAFPDHFNVLIVFFLRCCYREFFGGGGKCLWTNLFQFRWFDRNIWKLFTSPESTGTNSCYIFSDGNFLQLIKSFESIFADGSAKAEMKVWKIK